MKRLVVLLLITVFWLLLSDTSVEARVLPRYRSGGGRAVGSSVGASAYLRADRLALIVNFSNLSRARNVNYTLSYQTNGKDEGIGGSVDISAGNTTSRELLFGTCSSGVCRYHTGLSNMKLEIISELTSGKKTLKRFRIRV